MARNTQELKKSLLVNGNPQDWHRFYIFRESDQTITSFENWTESTEHLDQASDNELLRNT
jgi:hypothetical protein